MGIMRKATSISTLGIVDFRSDQERTARYTRQTRNAARLQAAQNARMMELERQQIAALDHANVREGARAANAGWFIDPWDHQQYRWFDGFQWTGQTHRPSPSWQPPQAVSATHMQGYAPPRPNPDAVRPATQWNGAQQ